jgi:hypothetical protein
MEKNGENIDEQLLTVIVNPLAFSHHLLKEIKNEQKITEKDILEYVKGYTMMPNVKNFVRNYEAISENINRLFAVPAETQINTKLIQPLRHAAGSFMLGNYLDTIAMCGFVSEMMTIFLYETSNIVINDNKISDLADDIFGRSFEKLGQDRRLKILKGFSIIEQDIFEKFDKIRLMRARYLHRFNEDHAQIAPDAKEIFASTLDLLISVFGQQIKDGKVYYNPNVV